ncbi:glycosyl hydrolase family 59 [Propionibacteriaceae bacterium ES.041]|uniref:hypothetical protein n=1 Tax=Enemella evansiae TaxID=2016499 RepID=UPI000C014B4F|nr:hypothetical protein [Enemella evansiae]PFG67346.1 glycosyl hydrolase family 59 [Propionibacteriaceae bacterium ES.041]
MRCTRKVRTAIATTAVVILAGLVGAPPARAEDAPVQITVNGNDVRADNANGLTYKGLGLVSANSTSNLLMDYKSAHPDQYWQLIRTMFGGTNPIIDNIKIEMGSDTNNSTGSDPATMRTADELADTSRDPGFQLAADAKTVNPELKVIILRWTMPEWVQNAWNQGAGTGYPAMYKWYKETTLDAYMRYGYMIDYVDPDTNETTRPDTEFVKWYRNAIDSDTDFTNPRYGIPANRQAGAAAAYRATRIVASDENTTMNIGPAMLTDPALFKAVDAAGYHYTTEDRHDGAPDSPTNLPYTKLALGQTPSGQDKEVWYAEGIATLGYSEYRANNNEGANGASTGIGGVQSALDVANRLVKGFANSKRTNYMFQPAIASFYDGAQYSGKQLVSAQEPWSGHIHYDASLYVMQQFTQFARMGWENDTNSAGRWRAVPQASYSCASGTSNIDGSNGAPSYLTLADPTKKDFSTVVVNDSDQAKTYRIKTANMKLGNDQLEAWETRAADPGQPSDANYLHLAGTVRPGADGSYTYTVRPRSIVTLTTLKKSTDPAMAERLPQTPAPAVLDTDATGKNPDTGDDYLYADDFDYAEEGPVQVGVANGSGKEIAPYLKSRGTLPAPDTVNGGGATRSIQTYLGSRGNQPRYLVDQTGAWEVGTDRGGNHLLYQYLDQSMKNTRAWNPAQPNSLVGDHRWQNYTASVDVSFTDAASDPAALGIRQQTGMTTGSAAYNLRVRPTGAWTLYRHDTAVASGTVAPRDRYRLALTGAGATITAAIDGRVVSNYTDPAPELAGRVNLGSGFYRTGFDNLKVQTVPGYTAYASSLIDNMDSIVTHTGTWSKRAANGDAMDWYRTTSTSSTAGSIITVPFTGTGLDILGGNGGDATLDIAVDGVPLARNAATLRSGKRQATYSLRGLPDGQHTATFTLKSGTLIADAFYAISARVGGSVDTGPIAAALAAVGSPNQSEYSDQSWSVFTATRAAAQAALTGQVGLDTVGVTQIARRLTEAYNALIPANTTDTQKDVGLAGALTTTQDLPSTVVIDGQSHPVTWSTGSRSAGRTAYTTLSVWGWTNDAYVDGKRQLFSANYEVVPPSLAYYIDSGVTSGQVSPQYAAVAANQPLMNGSADQASTGPTTWGYRSDGVNVKAGTNLSDKNSTGLWANSGRTIQYRLPLDPGTYTLTAGFHEWWGATRPMSQTVTIGATTTSGTPINLTPGADATGTVRFTVSQPTTITYTVAKAGGPDPVLSWLAVAMD